MTEPKKSSLSQINKSTQISALDFFCQKIDGKGFVFPVDVCRQLRSLETRRLDKVFLTMPIYRNLKARFFIGTLWPREGYRTTTVFRQPFQPTYWRR
jgi:hypothetical protein